MNTGSRTASAVFGAIVVALLVQTTPKLGGWILAAIVLGLLITAQRNGLLSGA